MNEQILPTAASTAGWASTVKHGIKHLPKLRNWLRGNPVQSGYGYNPAAISDDVGKVIRDGLVKKPSGFRASRTNTFRLPGPDKVTLPGPKSGGLGKTLTPKEIEELRQYVALKKIRDGGFNRSNKMVKPDGTPVKLDAEGFRVAEKSIRKKNPWDADLYPRTGNPPRLTKSQEELLRSRLRLKNELTTTQGTPVSPMTPTGISVSPKAVESLAPTVDKIFTALKHVLPIGTAATVADQMFNQPEDY